jgi:DNA-binding beta-propeller fold protein YncE
MTRSPLVGLVATLLTLTALPTAAHAAGPPTRDVISIGNNWDGTVHIVDAHSLETLLHLNVVPDLRQRRMEMLATNALYLPLRELAGEGHDQLVDDSFVSRDGRRLFVSRPSLTDVVAVDLATRRIVWRVKVDGNRSDHMALSPDGTRLLVSATTANVVEVIDAATGNVVTRFPSGDSPHESNFSKDGSRVFHTSIGRVVVPTSDGFTELAKGKKLFELVDTKTWKVLGSFDLNDKLAAFGRPDIDGTIRPMAIAPDERSAYFQTSYFHGFVDYDFTTQKVTRVVDLPARSSTYVQNSAHHGLALNPSGTKLCVAGTIDNYIAIVHTGDLSYKLIDTGDRPYWATNSADGRYCYVSVAGADYVSVISYADEREVARIPVGYHPQRIRVGRILASIVGASTSKGALRVRPIRRALKTSARQVAITVTSDRPLSAVNARMTRAGQTYARVSSNRLDGTATLVLRRTRAPRSGRYVITVTGIDVDGAATSKTIGVWVGATRHAGRSAGVT